MVCMSDGFAAQETLFVGVENCDQRHFGEVEAFTEQVDADQGFEPPFAKVAQVLDAFKGIELAVEPFALDAFVGEIEREVFGQALGERGHQNALADGAALFDLLQEVGHLAAGGLHVDQRVQQTGGPNHLLDDLAAGFFELVGTGSGRDIDHLVDLAFPFIEFERAVVERAGEAEPVFDQRGFAAVVAMEHAAHLRHGGVRLIDEQQKVVGEEAVERVGHAARRTAGEGAAVVFDARAVAYFLKHFDIETRAGVEPLSFEEFSLALEEFEPFGELVLDGRDGGADASFGEDEVFGRVNEELVLAADDLAAGGVDDRELLDFVAPELDAVGVLFVTGPNFDTVAADAELAAGKLDVVALVLNIDQAAKHIVAIDLLRLCVGRPSSRGSLRASRGRKCRKRWRR